jgi:hypothetical protein
MLDHMGVAESEPYVRLYVRLYLIIFVVFAMNIRGGLRDATIRKMSE